MRLLIDTDAFCKLGISAMITETLHLFGVAPANCGRLASLPYMLRRGRLRRAYGAESCDALIQIADVMPVAPEPELEWLEKLTHVKDIDPGEAHLLAAAATNPEIFVVFGDKRALRALKNVPEISVALAGRIAVLEVILMSLCEQLGPDEVRRRVQPLRASDVTVQICFSNPSSDPRDVLRSYFRALSAEVDPLVLWSPSPRGEV